MLRRSGVCGRLSSRVLKGRAITSRPLIIMIKLVCFISFQPRAMRRDDNYLYRYSVLSPYEMWSQLDKFSVRITSSEK